MAVKRFSKALFEANDRKARDAAKAWLSTFAGIDRIEDNPDRYGPDILYWTHPETPPERVEAEIKIVWKGGTFPYPTVQVLGRKEKYFLTGVTLFMLSDNGKDYLTIRAEDILASPKVVVRNKYVYDGEEFFSVPLDKVTFGVLP